MTGEIINLRQARKRKARSEREKTAGDNRARYGRSKSEKRLAAKTEDLAAKRLDAHRLTPDPVCEDDPRRPDSHNADNTRDAGDHDVSDPGGER